VVNMNSTDSYLPQSIEVILLYSHSQLYDDSLIVFTLYFNTYIQIQLIKLKYPN